MNKSGIEAQIQTTINHHLKWLGHVIRMPEERPAKKAFKWYPEEKRRHARPRTICKDTVVCDVQHMGINGQICWITPSTGWNK